VDAGNSVCEAAPALSPALVATDRTGWKFARVASAAFDRSDHPSVIVAWPFHRDKKGCIGTVSGMVWPCLKSVPRLLRDKGRKPPIGEWA